MIRASEGPCGFTLWQVSEVTGLPRVAISPPP